MAQISPELSEAERRRIREEMRYALAVLQEASPPPPQRNLLDRLLAYLSHGFVLLLAGSLITSFLVPRFQQVFEQKNKELSLMQECFSQFLLYANSIWQEYYLVFPLVLQPEINQEQYIKYLQEISTIKLKRYDAFAKVQSLAIVFRNTNEQPSTIEDTIIEYAVRVNEISDAIDAWLRNLYCMPNKCLNKAYAVLDLEFVPYNGFMKLQDLMSGIQENARQVSELMVRQIKSLQ